MPNWLTSNYHVVGFYHEDSYIIKNSGTNFHDLTVIQKQRIYCVINNTTQLFRFISYTYMVSAVDADEEFHVTYSNFLNQARVASARLVS